MSTSAVINHIQSILNACGDPVSLIPIGQPLMGENGQLIVEIRATYIMKKNNCCEIPPPIPSCQDNPDDSYRINTIRIGHSLADDYSKNHPFTDAEMRNMVCSKQGLFACYEGR